VSPLSEGTSAVFYITLILQFIAMAFETHNSLLRSGASSIFGLNPE